MDKIWEDMYAAALFVLMPRKISSIVEAGDVAAAVESESGKIYVGVRGRSLHAWHLCRAKRNF